MTFSIFRHLHQQPFSIINRIFSFGLPTWYASVYRHDLIGHSVILLRHAFVSVKHNPTAGYQTWRKKMVSHEASESNSRIMIEISKYWNPHFSTKPCIVVEFEIKDTISVPKSAKAQHQSLNF